MRAALQGCRGASSETHPLFALQRLCPPPSPGTAVPSAPQHPQWTTVGSDLTTAPISVKPLLSRAGPPALGVAGVQTTHHLEVSTALEDFGDVVNLPRRGREVRAILKRAPTRRCQRIASVRECFACCSH
jgi:hypothetical protein